jgi:hypothetical protein
MYFRAFLIFEDRTIIQAASRPLTANVWVQVSLLIHVRFVVDRVTLGQVFLLSLRLPPVSIIPPGLHTHLQFHLVPTSKQPQNLNDIYLMLYVQS